MVIGLTSGGRSPWSIFPSSEPRGISGVWECRRLPGATPKATDFARPRDENECIASEKRRETLKYSNVEVIHN